MALEGVHSSVMKRVCWQLVPVMDCSRKERVGIDNRVAGQLEDSCNVAFGCCGLCFWVLISESVNP